MLKQKFQLKLSQKLSPQQIQLMKLIQLSTLDLEQKIEAEIGENPALENGIEKNLEENQEDSFDDQSKIDTNEIDQIYDGEKFYTIIHENKEIIISTENTSFFNFSPNQIFNFFLKGFDLKRQNISNDKYFIAAESIEEEEIIYNLFIDSNLSIEKIEMIEKETGEEINKFLTLTYDYNLNIPLSLFKFDINDYEDYLIVKEN